MKITISGTAVVAVAGVVAAGIGIYSMRKSVGETVGKVVDAVNPASSTNVVYKAAEPVLNKQVGGYAWTDYLFAANELANPFNESDEYARQVWGIDKVYDKYWPWK